MLLSYFQLLVNTRDEIALARVIDVPTRGIDHVAFTKIRKMASAQNLPMYQVINVVWGNIICQMIKGVCPPVEV